MNVHSYFYAIALSKDFVTTLKDKNKNDSSYNDFNLSLGKVYELIPFMPYEILCYVEQSIVL